MLSNQRALVRYFKILENEMSNSKDKVVGNVPRKSENGPAKNEPIIFPIVYMAYTIPVEGVPA